MKRLLAILFFSVISVALNAQNDSVEYWRALGYQARVQGEYELATAGYLQVLAIDSNDYDARLATARLYTIRGAYDTAITYFNKIFSQDSTDVEALNGLGRCEMYQGNNKKAIHYFEKALQILPGNVQQYFYLAKVYSYAGKLKEAIELYNEINRIDNTYSEAWAGIGKMYYWQGKPQTAVSYYRRALELDPRNEEMKKELEQIKNELKFGLTLKFKPLKEEEETYEIIALVSSLKLEKRINDHFYLDVNVLADYSSRDFTNTMDDTTRWYDASWIKGGWISEHHKISAYVGYSITDNRFSAYGVDWRLNYSFGKFTIKNSFTAGYDYFYYWNKVGGKSISNNIELGVSRISLGASYTYGVVDPVPVTGLDGTVYDTLENPYQGYSISLAYKLAKNPVIMAGAKYSYLNHENKSPLYYTPYDRNLIGAFASIYYQIKKFFVYGHFAYNIGTEVNYEETLSGNTGSGGNGSGNTGGNNSGDTSLEETVINVDNWSARLELGYNLNPLTFTLGGSNFYNPFYQNITGFIAVKLLF